MERVLSLMADGRLKAIIDGILPLEEANVALERLERGEVIGRAILRHVEPS
jgi:D-arabinose 1-dehydrogenase-like Zn-dependent alcohol dehydrogenase